jgi:hypothetical protein
MKIALTLKITSVVQEWRLLLFSYGLSVESSLPGLLAQDGPQVGGRSVIGGGETVRE